MFKSQIKKGIKILTNMENEFSQLYEKKFEDVLYDYLKLLLQIAIFSGLLTLILGMIKAMYLQTFRQTPIGYMNYLNFLSGQAVGTSMGYLLAGTIVLFFIALILNITTKIKFTETLKRLFYSLTPLLLFGWFSKLALFLLIWAVFMFIVGSKFHKIKKIDKKSIQQRI